MDGLDAAIQHCPGRVSFLGAHVATDSAILLPASFHCA